MDTEIWISYNIHLPQNIILPPFKKIKTVFSLQFVQKQAVG